MYAGQLVEEGTVRQILKAPRHPYSRALIDCLPNLNDTSRHSRLAAIPGQVPNPGALPAGCLFAPRCVHAQAGLCDIAPAPRIETLADGQRVRCLRAQEISAGARSEEHTSELQSLMRISYAVFCLKKKNT